MNPLADSSDAQPAAATRVRDMIMGFRTTQLLYVVAKLDLWRLIMTNAQLSLIEARPL
jgi:hypothetical protein